MWRFHVLSMTGTVIRNQIYFFSSVWFREETEQVDEAMSATYRAFLFIIPWTLILILKFIERQETKYDDLSQISVIHRNHCSSSSIQLSNWKLFSVSIWIFMNLYCFSYIFLFFIRVKHVTQYLWKKNSLILMLKKQLLFIIVRK